MNDFTFKPRLLAIFSLTTVLLSTIVLPSAAKADPSPRQSTSTQTSEVMRKLADGTQTRFLAPARNSSELRSQIQAHLRNFPGGTQINENEIAYNGGKFIMTFAKPGGPLRDSASTLASDCTSGWFCFYDGTNFTYPRGRLSDCGWQDLYDFGWHDRTESVAQTQSAPIFVLYIGHEGTTPNHSGDDAYFFTDGSTRTIAAVPSQYRNAADHVNKNCPL